MQKYFISSKEWETCEITGESAFHIQKVIRLKTYDSFLVSFEGKTYLASVKAFHGKNVCFQIIQEEKGNAELPFFVCLFQGYPKGDKMEQIIKYGTQLGASAFWPVLMKHSVFRLDPSKKDAKLERLNKIALEAGRQSHRDTIPPVLDICDLKNVDFSSYSVKLVCYEEERKEEVSLLKKAIRRLQADDRVAIVVGPEGGIDAQELAWLVDNGFVPVGLGPRILRTETVVFYLLSVISYEWELK